MIAAVLFDLDDTLYDQQRWLDGAWHSVASHAAERGVDAERFERALRDLAAGGSDQGGIIDRALARVGEPQVSVAPLVATFRSHAPGHLDPYPGVVDALEDLHTRVPLGLISDGDPTIQRAKLEALDLARLFHTIVLSDEHGRAHRKPEPLPFRVALTGLGVDPTNAIYVGDRPEKDVAGAAAAGLRAIRVHTGEWRDAADDPRAWASVATVVDAIELLDPALPASRRARATVPSARG